MTTITMTLARVTYDSQGIPNSFEYVDAVATFHGDLPLLTYSVDEQGLASLDGQLFSIDFADGADYRSLTTVIGSQDWTTTSGQSGTTAVAYFLDPTTGTEYYAPLDGDPIPVTSLSELLSSGFDAVGSPTLLTGELGPGQNILPALTFNDPDYSNLRQAEDDVYNIIDSTSYFVFGSAGDDTIIGVDNQWDYVIYEDLDVSVDVNLLKGWAKKDGLGRDKLTSIEDIHGSNLDDRIVGDNSEDGNFFFGGEGNDIMRGRGANDNLSGEDGNDRVFGDDGEDTLDGGDGEDRIEGGAGNDSLSGGNDRDIMRGNQDNDQLFGGEGDDRMLGGTGIDALYGEDGDDDLFGNGGNDYIQGDAGIDKIDGGRNDDRIDGGSENDFLFGGAGYDVFVFNDIEDMGLDRIKDWQDGRDKIDVSDYGFTEFSQVQDLATDTNNGLRIRFEDDSTGDARLLFIENLLKQDFDATDVVLDTIA